MLSENLKSYRKKCGYTQEEVAEQLHVVRQTISKWEKGVSVPDADLLVRLANMYEVNVNELLGSTIPESEPQEEQIAKELAKVNEQLAIHNRRSKTFWRIVLIIGVLVLAWGAVGCVLAIVNYEMTVRSTNYATDTAMMILSSSMTLFRKSVRRAAVGLITTFAAGFMNKKR